VLSSVDIPVNTPGRIEQVLGTGVASMTELDGGMIGTVQRVSLDDGQTVVAKTGETPLTVEARMLQYLEATGLPVPTVLHAADDLLLLTYVDGESRITPAVERDAADRLASLHEITAAQFGFPFDTLTGPVTQPNPWTDQWCQFYRQQRLLHVRRLCLDTDVLDPALDRQLTTVLDRLSDLLTEPSEPALVHGDVWETNLLTDGDQIAAFLDPACYYGHPEIELAYIDWTETFGDAFFERYDTRRAIDDDFFETRRYIYRLYPLLVHLFLFGSPYGGELEETLAQIP
jgi:fructosamine-3-kinase